MHNFWPLILVAVSAWAAPPEPAEVQVGRRLFEETRFAEYFHRHNDGDVNQPLSQGDPVLARLPLPDGSVLPGPYRGKSMSCAACHLTREVTADSRLLRRDYTDFVSRSPIPEREDGRKFTPRNTPTLTNSLLERPVPLFLHYDGEFQTMEDLVKGGLTGRNFGWLPRESHIAVKHIARVIREDAGRATPESDPTHGLSYSALFSGNTSELPRELRLSPGYRLEVEKASDRKILEAVARLMTAFMRAQNSSQKSPYDLFLEKNGLPVRPAPGESDLEYSRRLRTLMEKLSSPRFVDRRDGRFITHDQEFRFGKEELEGMKIFFRETPVRPANRMGRTGEVGACIRCHAAPHFTDFQFHNIGVTQFEYDRVHGAGKFASLRIPSLMERLENPEAYLPGPFLAAADPNHPELTDLGLWNFFAHPDHPENTDQLRALICDAQGLSCSSHLPPSDSELLEQAVALFKTPPLRNLGHSAPYFHNGSARDLEEAMVEYMKFSNFFRAGRLRNGSVKLDKTDLFAPDLAPLAAFLRSLNEDPEKN